eukprot:scaffold7537_cov229-Pinguiococcus_pyrenoidosus.AAC.1
MMLPLSVSVLQGFVGTPCPWPHGILETPRREETQDAGGILSILLGRCGGPSLSLLAPHPDSLLVLILSPSIEAVFLVAVGDTGNSSAVGCGGHQRSLHPAGLGEGPQLQPSLLRLLRLQTLLLESLRLCPGLLPLSSAHEILVFDPCGIPQSQSVSLFRVSGGFQGQSHTLQRKGLQVPHR